MRTARDADLVVAVVGESQGMAHEASSRTDLRIPASQRRLLKALKATGKPLVLVLMNGRPLSLGWGGKTPTRSWKPGSVAPKAATPSPTCYSASTTPAAS